jgi:predicted ribosome quality control (RQC) complex YloA/Tae2 family protein
VTHDFATLRSLAAEIGQALGGSELPAAAPLPEGLLLVGPTASCRFRGGVNPLLTVGPGHPGGAVAGDDPVRYLAGARVDNVAGWPADRVIEIRLSRVDRSGTRTCGRLLYELLPGRGRAVLVSDRTGLVLGVWGATRAGSRSAAEPAAAYRPPPPQPRLVPATATYDDFAARLDRSAAPAALALASVLAMVDPACAAELLHRAGVPGDQDLQALPDADRGRLWQVILALWQGPAATGAWAWHERGREFCSSLAPTRLGAGPLPFADVSSALAWVEQQAAARAAAAAARQHVRAALHRARRTLGHRVDAMAAELAAAAEAETLERWGAALMAQLPAVPPGVAWVDLPDVFAADGGPGLRIPLDPGRPPAPQAGRYLKLAQRYARRRQVIPPRLAAARAACIQADAWLGELASAATPPVTAITRWLQEQGMVRDVPSPTLRGTVPEAHPRRYRTVDGGWSVWAGRNNQENDLVSHRLAAPNDLWFHAHGYSGSHVILRREGRKEEPSQRAVLEAAGVAAYWSKGRTARKVPVVCTLAKFVSKARGAPAGQAVIRREHTLMVAPALAPQEDAADASGPPAAAAATSPKAPPA